MMPPRWLPLLACALALAGTLVPARAAAQRLPAPRFAAASHFHPVEAAFPADTPIVSLKTHEPSTGRLVVGAVVGGALLGGLGAALGAAGGNDSGSGDGGLGEAIGAAVGALLLEPLGMGIGTNVANRGRGSAPLDVLTAAGTLVAVAIVFRENSAYVVIPAQVAATVAVERALGRRAKP